MIKPQIDHLHMQSTHAVILTNTTGHRSENDTDIKKATFVNSLVNIFRGGLSKTILPLEWNNSTTQIFFGGVVAYCGLQHFYSILDDQVIVGGLIDHQPFSNAHPALIKAFADKFIKRIEKNLATRKKTQKL